MKANLLLVFIAVALVGCGTTQPTLFKEPRILHSLKVDAKHVYCVAWSPDSTRIAIGGGYKNLSIWDADNGEKLLSFEGHKSAVRSVTWSPDGKHIASGGEDKTIVVWDAASGEKLRTFVGHTNTVQSVAWSPDGKYIASGSRGGIVRVWNTKNGKELHALKQPSWITSLAWSPSGRHLASGSRDRTVHIWDVASGKDLMILKEHASDDVQDVVWSLDGTKLISGVSATHDRAVRIWDVISQKVLLKFDGFGACVALSPNGEKIASGGGEKTIRIWDSANGKVLHSLVGHTFKEEGHDFITSVAWSPNGKAIVSSTLQGGSKSMEHAEISA